MKNAKITSKRPCAFISMDALDDFVVDDALSYPYFEDLGWEIDVVSWRRRDVNWADYDFVLIRTPWDYQQAPEDFMARLEEIERSRTPLYNSLPLIRWNLNKTYLRDIERLGATIVPTIWLEAAAELDFDEYFRVFSADEIVLKPTVSANADHTYRVHRDNAHLLRETLGETFRTRAAMAQPLLPSIVEEGEFSVLYFNGAFSHSIIKTPASGDFRVQEEHGGDIREAQADATRGYNDILRAATAAMQTVEKLGFETPLYARVDLARISNGGNADAFAVMELELIEPSLYLRCNDGAPERFARAVHERVNGAKAKGLSEDKIAAKTITRQ